MTSLTPSFKPKGPLCPECGHSKGWPLCFRCRWAADSCPEGFVLLCCATFLWSWFFFCSPRSPRGPLHWTAYTTLSSLVLFHTEVLIAHLKPPELEKDPSPIAGPHFKNVCFERADWFISLSQAKYWRICLQNRVFCILEQQGLRWHPILAAFFN